MFYGKRLKKIEEQQARIIKELARLSTEFERAKNKLNSLGELTAITHFDTEEYISLFVSNPDTACEMKEKKAEYENKLRRFIRSTTMKRKPKPKTKIDGKETTEAAE